MKVDLNKLRKRTEAHETRKLIHKIGGAAISAFVCGILLGVLATVIPYLATTEPLAFTPLTSLGVVIGIIIGGVRGWYRSSGRINLSLQKGCGITTIIIFFLCILIITLSLIL